MSLLQLLALAGVAMAGLALLRVIRVRHGRTPLPEGRGRKLFLAGFVILPPIGLSMLLGGATTVSALSGLATVPLYLVVLVVVAILMGVLAFVVRFTVRGRTRAPLLLALVGSEGDPDEVPFDPPVTARLAQCVVQVDRANGVFPRGTAFPTEVERADFRGAWDALDAATGTLESRIADDRRLGVAVASSAMATAIDARSRLETLRRLATAGGGAWSPA
jgi:hypothetical protein